MFLLWDIDGTLIRGARSAAQAFVTALREVYHLPEQVARISYGGKTDQQIAREILSHHDMYDHAVNDRFAAFRERYIAEFQHLEQQLRHEVEILPGVQAVLEHLKPLATQALLTGNIEAGAKLKLRAANLTHWFNWQLSAFGSDREQRNELVPLALERATSYGSIKPQSTLVIGDTPYDIACARAGGVKVLAVATGSYTRESLAQHHPDALLDSLSDTQAVVELIKQLTI